MIDGMAVRTKFFDDSMLASAAAGVRQVVILASGLDARAYRLGWPPETVIYELDQPQVIEFKTQTLAGLGAQPRDPANGRHRPAAGLAGGVTRRRLRRDAADGLAGRGSADLPALRRPGSAVRPDHRAVGPGSTVSTEYVPGIVDFDTEKARALAQPLQQHGLDLDMSTLVYAGERSRVGTTWAAWAGR